MATIVEVTVPAEGFPLGTVFRTRSDVTIELERFVPTSSVIIPYCWIHGGSIEEVTTTLQGHPSITAVTVVDTVESQFLLRMEWEADSDGLVKMLSTMDLVVLSATGNATEWTFEIRADDQTALSEFQRYCREHDIPLRVTTIHQLVPPETASPKLTSAQREALLAAYDAGYFNTPREATLEEVGEQLSISRQAVANRLRCGHNTLIGRLNHATS